MTSGKQKRSSLKAARRLAAKRTKCVYASSSEAPCNVSLLAPDNSYGVPEFVTRGTYRDQPFRCQDCGRAEMWTAAQQKWWYETAKGWRMDESHALPPLPPLPPEGT